MLAVERGNNFQTYITHITYVIFLDKRILPDWFDRIFQSRAYILTDVKNLYLTHLFYPYKVFNLVSKSLKQNTYKTCFLNIYTAITLLMVLYIVLYNKIQRESREFFKTSRLKKPRNLDFHDDKI